MNIPEKFNLNSSDILLLRKEDGTVIIGFYNYDNIGDKSGYYETPDLTDKIVDFKDYSIAPVNSKFKCNNCNEIIRRDKVGASPYIPQIGGQSFPCCNNCSRCLRFEFVGFDEEE